jgi:hypothetical protein
MTFKDWFTTIVASMALFISASTAYFSVLRVVDDVRVRIEGGVTMTLNEDTSGFDVSPAMTDFFKLWDTSS